MTMDVTKAPPLDPSATRAGAGPTSQQSAAAPSSGSIVALADRVDIQPLDVAAALQILIAEVRMAMELPADSSTMQSPAQTSRVLIQMFLHAVPEGASSLPVGASSLPAGAPASIGIELAFLSAIDRAVDAVAAWRDVPQFVVDAAKETRALVVLLLTDEPLSPMWLRPEWLGLAPRIERFWRRRRLTRRGLADPDFRSFREADERDPDSVEDKLP
jgi:hypothetical protein